MFRVSGLAFKVEGLPIYTFLGILNIKMAAPPKKRTTMETIGQGAGFTV